MSKMTPEMIALSERLALGITGALEAAVRDLPEEQRIGVTMGALICCTNGQVIRTARRSPDAAALLAHAAKNNIDQALAGMVQPIGG